MPETGSAKESSIADGLVSLGESKLNQEEEVVLAQINQNIRCQWPQIRPHSPNDIEIVIACGGPSLKGEFAKLQELVEAGCPVVATNATAKWLLDRGITPNVHFVVDSREENKRFIDPPILTCTYILATQCHPSLFDALAGHPKAYMGHFGNLPFRSEIPKYFRRFVAIPSGCSVGLSAIASMSMLGYKKQHVFGFDSCYMDSEHHSYSQEENDKEPQAKWEFGGRTWHGAIWMMRQAEDFIRSHSQFDKVASLKDTHLCVYGDGLIRFIMENYDPDQHGENMIFTLL